MATTMRTRFFSSIFFLLSSGCISAKQAAVDFPIDFIEHDYLSVTIFGVSAGAASNRLNQAASAGTIRLSPEFTTRSHDHVYIARLLAMLHEPSKAAECTDITEVIWVIDFKSVSKVVTFFSDGKVISGPNGCQEADGLESLDVMDALRAQGGSTSLL
jgi:hypothetical protein